MCPHVRKAARALASKAISILLVIAPATCRTSETLEEPNDAAAPHEAARPADATSLADGGQRDEPASEDGRPGEVDVDASAALDADAAPDADAALDADGAADADATPGDTIDADVSTTVHDAANEDTLPSDDGDADALVHDAGDGDGALCACVEFDVEAGSQVVTTEIGCFKGRFDSLSFADYLLDPCVGLHTTPPFNGYWGTRFIRTYPDHHLIGIETGGLDSPTEEYFFDDTSRSLVGAMRTSSWSGRDPVYCSTPPLTSGRYTTVRAGRLPNCDWNGCPFSSSQMICPPPEAGAPDAGRTDGVTPDASTGR